MLELDRDIMAFEALREELEERHRGEWVLIQDQRLIGTFGSFDLAAQEAVRRFGRGPYLIRQIGAPEMILPASVMYPIA